MNQPGASSGLPKTGVSPARQLRAAVLAFAVLTLLTGVAYPLCMTGVAQLAFPYQANGSLVVAKGSVVGSRLIGQSFDAPGYFWSRPSATWPVPYDAAASQGSNLGPSNGDLLRLVEGRLQALQSADPGAASSVPVDLVTASGSGLDPHISVAAAEYQVDRVARARGRDPVEIRALVARYTEQPQLGILGGKRVNVLALNLALDGDGL
jgi:K+-transporting ATPase ATPase C chain